MTPESDKGHPVPKSIAPFVHSAPAPQSPMAAGAGRATCHLDQLKSLRLQRRASPTSRRDGTCLRALIRIIIGRKLQLAVASPRPLSPRHLPLTRPYQESVRVHGDISIGELCCTRRPLQDQDAGARTAPSTSSRAHPGSLSSTGS